MENPNALSKLRPGLPKCYTYSEPEDESSDELETSKDGKVKPKPKVVKRIRKKRGRKKRYHPIIDDIRQELIDAVNNKGEKIKEAAERLQINYSSAKSIFQVFKKEGRLNRKVLIRKPLFSQDQTAPKKQDTSQENKSPASIQENLIEVVDNNTVETQNTQISNSDQDDSTQIKQPTDLSKYNYNSQFFPSSFANKHLMDPTFIQNIGVPTQVPGKTSNINYPRHPMQGPFGASVGLFDMNNSPNMYFTPSVGLQDFKNRNPTINPNLYYNTFPNYQQQPNFAQNWNWSKAPPNPFMASYYNANTNFYNPNVPDHRAPNLFLLNADNSSAAEDQVALKEEFDGIKREYTGFSTKIENFDHSSQV